MDFFQRQDTSRRNTRRLVVFFFLGLALLTMAGFCLVLVSFLSSYDLTSPAASAMRLP